MSFTGSPEVGRLIAQACGRNLVPVKLELGGKGAAVVFDNVALPQTVKKLARAIIFHTGQVCCDATRWLVQRPIYKQFVAASRRAAVGCKIGYRWSRDANGPGGQRKTAASASWATSAAGARKGPECSWKAGREVPG